MEAISFVLIMAVLYESGKKNAEHFLLLTHVICLLFFVWTSCTSSKEISPVRKGTFCLAAGDIKIPIY